MANFKDLDVWKTAMNFTDAIYIVTRTYPKDELFGLVSQTKRAAVSIPSNIAEGLGRKSKKDTAHFLIMARGSGFEIETLLRVAFRAGILSAERFEELENLHTKSMQLLQGLLRHYEQRDTGM